MRIFNKDYLVGFQESARHNGRLREHLNLHMDFEEKVQRLFIAMSKGSYVEPHYHELPHQWEMFVVLEGVVEVVFYNQKGRVIQKILVGENQDCRALELQPFDIHSVECISDKALLLEIKEGPFKPETSKVVANFLSSF